MVDSEQTGAQADITDSIYVIDVYIIILLLEWYLKIFFRGQSILDKHLNESGKKQYLYCKAMNNYGEEI